MADWIHPALIVAVTAACTIFTRFFPFVLFGGKRKMPRFVQYLGGVLPAAIIATLVVYCLKDLNFSLYPFGIPQLIAVAVVVALHLWKSNTLISIFGGTAVYMALIHLF